MAPSFTPKAAGRHSQPSRFTPLKILVMPGGGGGRPMNPSPEVVASEPIELSPGAASASATAVAASLVAPPSAPPGPPPPLPPAAPPPSRPATAFDPPVPAPPDPPVSSP